MSKDKGKVTGQSGPSPYRAPFDSSGIDVTSNFRNGDIGTPHQPLITPASRPPTLRLSEQDFDAGDLGVSSLTLNSPMRTSSRLSKTLLEVLHNSDAVSYFVQFMESRKVGQLVQFWLDADSFQAATWSRIRTHSLSTLKKSYLIEKIPTISSKQEKDINETSDLSEAGLQSLNNGAVGIVDDNELVIEKPSHISQNDIFGNFINCDKDMSDQTDIVVTKDNSNIDTFHEHDTAARGCENDRDRVVSDTSLPGVDVDIPTETCVEDRMHSASEQPDNSKFGSVLTDPVHASIAERNKQGLSKDEIARKLIKSIERDAVKIFTKYLAQDATHPIKVCDELRNATIGMICKEDGEVDVGCFIPCQQFVVERMEKEHYHDFLSSEFHCRHQIDVLTSGKIYLGDFLYNEAALIYFMEYIEQEKASNLLQFWLAADNFQQLLITQGQYDGDQAQNDAMVLYDKYFSLQATQPLGFSDKIRFEVESNICREQGPLPDCFAKPRDMVLRTMEKDYFPNFLQSEMYYKCLSEFVSSIQTAQIPTHRKRAGSESPSENSMGSHSTGGDSISSMNTLLAKDGSCLKKALSKLNEDIGMDTVLLNPDMLWKRTNSGNLSVGKIDKLGQFTSEFDPEPDIEKRKDTGFFKKKREKNKEDQEMALKIAQMIISDVTAVTDAISSMKVEASKNLV